MVVRFLHARTSFVVLTVVLVVGSAPVRSAHAAKKKGEATRLYESGAKEFASGDYRAAAKLFHEAFALDPDPAYVFSEASCYRRLEEHEEAARLYERYLVVVPEGERPEKRAKARAYAVGSRVRAGFELKKRGDCEPALEQLMRALRHDRDNGEAWAHVGECRVALGDRAGARAAFEKALADERLDAVSREKAKARLGELASAEGSPPPAAAALSVPDETEKAVTPDKRRPPWGVILGVGGGVLAVGAGVLIGVLVAVRSAGSVDVSGTELGVLEGSL